MKEMQHPNIRRATTGILKTYDLIVHNGSLDEPIVDGKIGPLIRDYHVVRYCLSGRATVHYNDMTFPVKAGQCYVLFSGDATTEITDADDPLRYAWITILGVKAAMLFKSFGVTPSTPLLPWTENPCFLERMREGIHACEGGYKRSELRRISKAYALFDELQNYFIGESDGAEELANSQEQYVSEALYYMEMECAGKLTVSDVAAHVGLNRSYFSSIFKEHTKISPQEYLILLRMSKACELFRYPNSTVANVANSLGLEASVFFRHFKRIYGITPSEYKKRVSQLNTADKSKLPPYMLV